MRGGREADRSTTILRDGLKRDGLNAQWSTKQPARASASDPGRAWQSLVTMAVCGMGGSGANHTPVKLLVAMGGCERARQQVRPLLDSASARQMGVLVGGK